MGLPPLATVEALAGYMQVDPDTLPASAGAALDMVSAIIRREARNSFTRKTSTLERWPVDGYVTLPLRPVVSVDSVYRDGRVESYVWHGGIERLFVSGCAPVSVTFTHGYAEVPMDVVAVALTAAQRLLGNPKDLRTYQETVGSLSVTETYSAETIGASLSPADKDLLGSYRRRAAVVRQV